MNANPVTGTYHWDTTKGNIPINYNLYLIRDELHTFGKSKFEPLLQVEITEIAAELIKDALSHEGSGWESSSYGGGYHTIIDHNNNIIREWSEPVVAFYSRDGLDVAVHPDRMEFGGKDSWLLNPKANLITDADKLVGFLDWVYDKEADNPLQLNFEKLVKGKDNGCNSNNW